jgi:hypothetical protein
MMGAWGGLFWIIYSLVMAVALALGLVWFYFSVRFFNRASEYYQREIAYFKKRDDDMKELLAKFDQLVDVLKVK